MSKNYLQLFENPPSASSSDDDDEEVETKVEEEEVETEVEEEEEQFHYDKSSLVRAITGFGVSEDLAKESWSLFPMETKKIMEEKWRVLQAEEVEFIVEKICFLFEVASTVAAAI